MVSLARSITAITTHEEKSTLHDMMSDKHRIPSSQSLSLCAMKPTQ